MSRHEAQSFRGLSAFVARGESYKLTILKKRKKKKRRETRKKERKERAKFCVETLSCSSMFMTQEIIPVVLRRAKHEISAAVGLVFAGAPRACNVLLRGGVSALTVVYPSERRRADGGPAPQVSLAVQEVLPHPAGLSGGGVPDTLGGRWQALQRGVQRKREPSPPQVPPRPCRAAAAGRFAWIFGPASAELPCRRRQ